MKKQIILSNIYHALKSACIIRNQRDFASRIHYNYCSLSSALHGEERCLNDNLFYRILKAFPEVNREYVTTGLGDVLNSYATVNGTGFCVHSSNRPIDELRSMREELKQLISDAKSKLAVVDYVISCQIDMARTTRSSMSANAGYNTRSL